MLAHCFSLFQVLQIIPKSMFEILDQVISIRTETPREVPTRLEKDELKIYAQLDVRYQVRLAAAPPFPLRGVFRLSISRAVGLGCRADVSDQCVY